MLLFFIFKHPKSSCKQALMNKPFHAKTLQQKWKTESLAQGSEKKKEKKRSSASRGLLLARRRELGEDVKIKPKMLRRLWAAPPSSFSPQKLYIMRTWLASSRQHGNSPIQHNYRRSLLSVMLIIPTGKSTAWERLWYTLILFSEAPDTH